MMLRHRLVACLMTALCGIGAEGRAQPRDTSGAVPGDVSGAPVGSVSGVVTLTVARDEPARRAVVSLVPVDGGDGLSTVTGDDGRFVLRRVPAGRYALVAQKPAYITTHYGATQPGRAGVSIVVAGGSAVEGLRIDMPRGAVITGRLTPTEGASIRGIRVLAIPVGQLAARGRFDTRARPFYSDDRGVFRIYGLLPGDYLVAALPPAGSGQVERRTPDEYDEIVRALTRRGGRPGGTGADRLISAGQVERLGYAPSYYPGTAIAAEARPIHVSAGEVRDGVDMPLTMLAMSQISGTVVGIDGRPTREVQLSIAAHGPPLPLSVAAALRPTPPDAEGRFTISNVPPGDYTLTARGGGVTVDGRATTIRRADQTAWATTDVRIAGGDVAGLLLSLQPGLAFSGRVVASGRDTPDLRGTRVALVAAGTDPFAARSAVVDEQGAFSVTGLHPDTYEVVITLPGSLSDAWAVRSVAAGGIDLRDRPLTFDRGSVDDVTVTLTDARTEIAGTLSTPDGIPTSDYFIVVFPEERERWHAHSPRVRVVRPAADGTFSVRDLPPGAYRIVAMTDVGDEWRESWFLDSIVSASIPIVVRDGATTRQDFRVR